MTGPDYKKWAKRFLIVVAVYVGIVVLFESSLGFFQPEAGNTVMITTFDEDNNPHQRVVSLLSSGDSLYVAVNHWPRAWYRRVRDNGRIQLQNEGRTTEHRGVVVSGAEHDRVQQDNPTGLVFRLLTGFPPRYFVRLDPQQSD
ncbi:MAG: hypothetical protein RL839_16225 [Gammaproteobacteria bacterium]